MLAAVTIAPWQRSWITIVASHANAILSGATGGEAAAADAPAAEGSSVPAAAPSAAPVAEDLNDEDDDAAEEFALAEPAAPKKRAAKAGARQQSTVWVGNSTAMADGRHMYG